MSFRKPVVMPDLPVLQMAVTKVKFVVLHVIFIVCDIVRSSVVFLLVIFIIGDVISSGTES